MILSVVFLDQRYLRSKTKCNETAKMNRKYIFCHFTFNRGHYNASSSKKIRIYRQTRAAPVEILPGKKQKLWFHGRGVLNLFTIHIQWNEHAHFRFSNSISLVCVVDLPHCQRYPPGHQLHMQLCTRRRQNCQDNCQGHHSCPHSPP